MNNSASVSRSRGGRFAATADTLVEAFNASIAFDKVMYREDISASIAHATMLARTGILGDSEAELICQGLARVREEIARGEMVYSNAQEDIHMHVEDRLIQLIGEVGKKLHTGRSRNDQIATDMRLWTRTQIDNILKIMRTLIGALLDLATREQQTIMPGFTHLQIAQPISFAHHLLAWVAMLRRDYARLIDCRTRVNQLPLGAAALAGTSYPLDREFVAQQLGFAGVMDNSLDAVSDRDFAIEFCSCAALGMVHLSRWCEELILWSSSLTGFITLPDSLCTGSSIMPQKKNPDLPELIRGKSAGAIASLQSLLVLMKGQPLSYNKDNQEDKPPLFNAAAGWHGSLQILATLIPHIQTNGEAMRAAFRGSYASATDMADYLVGKGVSFRDAHAQVGALVRHAITESQELEDLPLQTIQQFCPAAQEDVYLALDLDHIVSRRTTIGGTAPQQVAQQLAGQRAWLEDPDKT